MKKVRVVVVGTGAMGRGIVSVLRRTEDIKVVGVADSDHEALERTRSLLSNDALVTTDAMEIFNTRPDILVEATPTILEAALLVTHAIEQKVHVVLMNAEVDQAFGRLLYRRAKDQGVVLTSDAGDQHGVIVRTMKDVRGMGFEVVLAGNNKGFLDRYANPETIREEAIKRRLSLRQCAAYTDGTKLAIEMAIVANAMGFRLFQTGMLGPAVRNVVDALRAFDLERARRLGGVVDYVLGAEPGGSVFVIGYSNDQEDRFYMDYYKMGEGPYYLFTRPYHLSHFETPVAIRSIMEYGKPILVQERKILEVGCRAKTDLPSGTKLEGIGGHHLYGILEEPGTLPIALAEGIALLNPKQKDEPIAWNDVAFPEDDPCVALWEEQARLEA